MMSATTAAAAAGGGGSSSDRSCFKVGETRRSSNVEVVLVLTTRGAASSELRSRIISGF